MEYLLCTSGSIQNNTTWTSPNIQNNVSALFSVQQVKKMFKFEEQFFYLLIIKNYEQFEIVIRGTTGSKFYQIWPEKENTDRVGRHS